jgi:hypothetical protein
MSLRSLSQGQSTPRIGNRLGGLSSGDATTTVVIMSESSTADDPLAGWDPRRRAALERLRRRFKQAGGDKVSLADELIAERRREAAAEDGSIGK